MELLFLPVTTLISNIHLDTDYSFEHIIFISSRFHRKGSLSGVLLKYLKIN